MLLAPCGAGCDTVNRRLFARKDPAIFFLLEVEHMRRANVVRTYAYVHLGSVIEANVGLVFDMKWRLKHAQDAARPLAKSVSGTAVCLSRSVPPFSAVLALSRGIHKIGAWSDPSKSDLRMWQAGCLNLYRFLLPSHLRESHLISICRLANMPAPSVLIKFERLRLLGQIASKGFNALLQLLESAAGNPHC